MGWLAWALIVMVACACTSIPFGAWYLRTSRLPSWMRGALKWPLGDRVSPQVVRLQGWANVFVGSASLVMAVLLVALPALLAVTSWPVRRVVGIVLGFVVALIVCGVVPYVRSVRLSRI